MIERINIKKMNMKYCDYLQVYIPDDYNQSKEEYPVIYMHDGHNLFDKKTSAFGMVWGVDKVLQKRKKQYIIIGIECSNIERYNLYSPWKYSFDHKVMDQIFQAYGGLGNDYLKWITSDLITFINQKYRTNKIDTYLAGSSMGGLISLYAGLIYNQTFRAVGVFSPAIWFAKAELLEWLKTQQKKSAKIYLDIGHKESSHELVSDFPEIYLQDAREVHKILSDCKLIKTCYIEDENGLHNELNWGKRFSNFLDFIENESN